MRKRWKNNTRDPARHWIKRNLSRNRSGQVWIETVIYTLIAFVMIGLVLSYARPEIEKIQDRAILQQSTEMMDQIYLEITSMSGAGNQRILKVGIKEGNLKIDAVNEKIIFELETKNDYSQPGKQIRDRSVIILTEEKTGGNIVTLTGDYSSNYDLKFEGKDKLKTISKASNSYKLLILNEGEDASGKIVMNISID